MGYQWGKSPLGAAGWKARALAAEERATKFAAEIERLQQELGDARTESRAARHEIEKAHRSAWDATERLAGKCDRLRDRSERNAARVRMLAWDLRDQQGITETWRHEAGDARGRIRQQWRTVLELRRRLEVRAGRVEALAGDLRDARATADALRLTLERDREKARAKVQQLERSLADVHGWARDLDALRLTLERDRKQARVNVQQLERSLADANARAAEAEKKAAAPAPELVAWEARVRDLEGVLMDQQSLTEDWKREAGDARRAVTMLRSALTTARFNAAHTGSEAARVLEQTEEIDYRDMRKG